MAIVHIVASEAEAVVKGRTTFDAFLRKTRPFWRACALKISTKFAGVVEPDDLEQELIFSVWRHIPRYVAGGGLSAAAYLTHWAARAVEKIARRQARQVLALRRYACEVEHLAGVIPPADVAYDRRDAYTILRAVARDDRQRAVLLALEHNGGNNRAAIVCMMHDPALRSICRLETTYQAARVVDRTVQYLCDTYGMEARS